MERSFLTPGHTIHHYRIIEVLKGGETYHLYRAQNIHSQIEVLIKTPNYSRELLSREKDPDGSIIKKRQELEKEIALLSELTLYDSTSVPIPLDIFTFPYLPPVLRELLSKGVIHRLKEETFFVREWLQGKPLSTLLSDFTITFEAGLRICRKLALFLKLIGEKGYRYKRLTYDDILISEHTGHISICHYRSLLPVSNHEQFMNEIQWLGHLLYSTVSKEPFSPTSIANSFGTEFSGLVSRMLSTETKSISLDEIIQSINRILTYPENISLKRESTEIESQGKITEDKATGKKFLILSQFSQGGRGVLYRVKDAHTGALLLLKTTELELRKELEREYKGMVIFSRITPQCPQPVALIRDVSRQDDIGLVLKEITGVSLADLVKFFPKRILPERLAIEIGRKIAVFLKAIHTCGIEEGKPQIGGRGAFLYQDLKPQNIIIDLDLENLYIVDFGGICYRDPERGISPVEAGIGTPGYLAPEALKVGSCMIDTRADIYAWGAVMFEILSGVSPCELAKSRQEALERQKDKGEIAGYEPQDYEYPVLSLAVFPSVSIKTRTILEKALARDPDERYSNVNKLIQDMEDALRLTPNTVKTTTRKLVSSDTNREIRDLDIYADQDHICLRWTLPPDADDICIVRWHGNKMQRDWLEKAEEYMDYEVSPGEIYTYTVYLKKDDGSLSQGVSITGKIPKDIEK